MLDRRAAIKAFAGLAAVAGAQRILGAEAEETVTLPVGNGERHLVAYRVLRNSRRR